MKMPLNCKRVRKNVRKKMSAGNLDFRIVKKKKYSWPSVSMGSTSADSTNWGSKILGKKSRKLQKAELEFAACWQIFTLAFPLYYVL